MMDIPNRPRPATPKAVQDGTPVAGGREKSMDISDWRKKIDELDQRLVHLLNERAKIAREIGKLKQSTHKAVRDPKREKRIFENICGANRGPLADTDIRSVYRRIINVMRGLQKAVTRPYDPSGRTDPEIQEQPLDTRRQQG
jgi:chorismate mutase